MWERLIVCYFLLKLTRIMFKDLVLHSVQQQSNVPEIYKPVRVHMSLTVAIIIQVTFRYAIFAHSWHFSLPFITVFHVRCILTTDTNMYA